MFVCVCVCKYLCMRVAPSCMCAVCVCVSVCVRLHVTMCMCVCKCVAPDVNTWQGMVKVRASFWVVGDGTAHAAHVWAHAAHA